MSERKKIGTLHAQLVGRVNYKAANSTPGKSFTLSRSHPIAIANKEYDDNSTVVLNDRGEVVGAVARVFAALVAPIIDSSLASLKCTVPKVEGLGGSMSLQYNPGENLDLHIRVYASQADLPRLERLGVLSKLTKRSSGDDVPVPVPRSAVTDTKRAREEGYTNLKDTSNGKFSCYLVVHGCETEVMFEEKIRFPDAWLRTQKFPANAEEVVIYRTAASAGEKDKVVLRKSLAMDSVAKEDARRKRHKKE